MNLSCLIDFSCKTCKVLHLYHPAKSTSFSSLGVAMTWGWWEVWPLICASLHKRILGMSQNDSEWPIFNWLVWNMTLFFRIVGIIFPTDELIFFRGVGQPPTRFHCVSWVLELHRYHQIPNALEKSGHVMADLGKVERLHQLSAFAPWLAFNSRSYQFR